MKDLLNEVKLIFVYIIAVFMLGILPSMLVSSVVIITTETTWYDCVTYPPFWILTVIFWIVFAIHFKELRIEA